MSIKPSRGQKKNKLHRFFVYWVRLLFRLFALCVRKYITPSAKKSLLRFQRRFQNSPTIELACSPGNIVMQVGTPNVSTIIRYSKSVGVTGHVYIVEGSTQTFHYLKKSILHLTNVTLINEVVSNSPVPVEWIETNIPGDNKISSGETSIDNDFRPDLLITSKTLKQPLSLDELLHKYNITFLDYISITVNGAEYSVLQSCDKALSLQLFDIIYSKAHAVSIKDDIPYREKIKFFLEKFAYDVLPTAPEPSPLRGYKRSGDIIAFNVERHSTHES